MLVDLRGARLESVDDVLRAAGFNDGREEEEDNDDAFLTAQGSDPNERNQRISATGNPRSKPVARRPDTVRVLLLTANLLRRTARLGAVFGRLTRLALGNNLIAHVDSLPPSLVELDLASNRLTKVPAALAACARLEHLDLGYNDVRELMGLEGKPLVASIGFAAPLLLDPGVACAARRAAPRDWRVIGDDADDDD